MTPKELVSYLHYEVIVVPLAWVGSDLPIGDTDFSIIFRFVFLFFISWVVVMQLLRAFITRPLAFLWAKLRRREFEDDDWESAYSKVAMLGGFIVVLSLCAFYSESFNS